MDGKIALTIAALTLMAIGVAIMLPGGREPDPVPKLPWSIQAHPDGSSSVFGLTLGRSTLADAESLFEAEAELTLFAAPQGERSVEAFFGRLFLSGLRADMVVTLELPKATMDAMYDRGIRSSRLGSGETKVTLSPADAAAARNAPIRHITYLPTPDLDPELLQSRFGTPAQRIPGPDEVVHWLYPETGLDIAVDPARKEVLQYVAPRDFQRLILAPLTSSPEGP
jgi:hypothetical protein